MAGSESKGQGPMGRRKRTSHRERRAIAYEFATPQRERARTSGPSGRRGPRRQERQDKDRTKTRRSGLGLWDRRCVAASREHERQRGQGRGKTPELGGDNWAGGGGEEGGGGSKLSADAAKLAAKRLPRSGAMARVCAATAPGCLAHAAARQKSSSARARVSATPDREALARHAASAVVPPAEKTSSRRTAVYAMCV